MQGKQFNILPKHTQTNCFIEKEINSNIVKTDKAIYIKYCIITKTTY